MVHECIKSYFLICRLTQDEASLHLSDNVRIFIKSLGSSYVSQIKWRTMWAFVVQRLKSHNIVYGESIQHVSEHEKWGLPVHLHTMVKLLPEVHIKCDWDDLPANRRRREFCDKYEGYSHVCSCKCFLNVEHFSVLCVTLAIAHVIYLYTGIFPDK